MFGFKFPKTLQEAEQYSEKQARAETVKFVLDEYERRKKDRIPYEQQWRLNANFYEGNQYCEINTFNGYEIRQIAPFRPYESREVFNKIAPIIETRIANLQKINYAMTVKPRRNDIDDYAKAEVSTNILKYYQDVSNFNMMKNQAIVWNEICGSCFWICGWNRDKGVVTDREWIEEVDENDEIQYKLREYHEGDIEYSLLSPYEVYPDDIMTQKVENQRSILVVQVMSVNDAYDRYGIKYNGTTVNHYNITPKLQTFGYGQVSVQAVMTTDTKENAVKIFTYYEKKNREHPEGRVVVVADVPGDDNALIYDGPLGYDEIPIKQVVCKSVSGQFFGKSVIETLIPLQKKYNRAKNKLHEYIDRCVVQAFKVPKGSIDLDEFEEKGLPPGGVLPYEPGFGAPDVIQNGQLPGEVMKEIEVLEHDMEYAAGVSQLQMIGAAPSGVKSGNAIESLREIDNTRMAMTGDYIRESVKELAVLWLHMYKKFVKFPRVIKHVGLNGIGNALVWSGEDITSFEVDFDTENELVVSEEMQHQRFMEAVQLGLYNDENGQLPQRVKNMMLEKLKVGSYSEMLGVNGLQIQAAQRENTFMRSGMFCDINPYDDDDIHAEEHKRFILSMEYDVLKFKSPEFAKLILAHAQAHEARAKEKKAAEAHVQMPLEGEM